MLNQNVILGQRVFMTCPIKILFKIQYYLNLNGQITMLDREKVQDFIFNEIDFLCLAYESFDITLIHLISSIKVILVLGERDKGDFCIFKKNSYSESETSKKKKSLY